MSTDLAANQAALRRFYAHVNANNDVKVSHDAGNSRPYVLTHSGYQHCFATEDELLVALYEYLLDWEEKNSKRAYHTKHSKI